jgi:predicted nucleic acid-binding protein
MKPTLYLETTIPSYLTARPFRDVVVLAHQQITIEWWDRRRSDFEIFVSQVVLDEAAMGDADAAKRRLESLASLPLLEANEEVQRMAHIYTRQIPLPPRAARDAAHMAFASVHGIEYLLTWNCTHIARGEVKRALLRINTAEGIETPTICTPEELMEE